MALNIKTSAALHHHHHHHHPSEPYPHFCPLLNHRYAFPKRRSSSSVLPFIRLAAGAQSEKTESATETEESSSARAQLDLLDQLTSSGSSTSDSGSGTEGIGGTIRDQLVRLVGDRDDDFTILLGKKNLKKVSPKFLTTSQKRNIRRRDYLNQVSKRNDSVFFATIGAFVLLPPLIILALAVLTGYVQLFP